MNQEEWWRSLIPQTTEPLTIIVGDEEIKLDTLFERIATEATRRGEEGKSYKARAITKLAGMRCRCRCQRNNVIDEIIDVLKTL